MDLHYSQTMAHDELGHFLFYYLMDLHYSQTPAECCIINRTVLLPYGFTLFSNTIRLYFPSFRSFTTLWIYTILKRKINLSSRNHCFTTLWIYTILKRRVRAQEGEFRFTTLWIYTILKRCVGLVEKQQRFTTLWIYTILKQHPDSFR